MKSEIYFAAVDLGATSGRVILATLTDRRIELEEINRFPNRIIETCGHCYWDLPAIYANIIDSLKLIARRGIELQSIGVDTWGVDFVLFGDDGLPLGWPFSYRDPHTEGAPERLFERMPREQVYAKTGIQIMNFNSLFQLDTMRCSNSTALRVADKILFLPDAISYLLTGKAVTEYSIASTSQMINPWTKHFDSELLDLVGLTDGQFGRQVMPGTVIGTLTESVQCQTGLGAVDVVAVAGHDTASAVAAVPAVDRNFAYLSSGTWSLMGVESPEPVVNERSSSLNFTNEGGVDGTIRLLKNICGMWLLERCRTEWDESIPYGELIDQAKGAEPFRSLIFPDAPCFANPQSMTTAIAEFCGLTGQPVPQTVGQTVRCIFESLALRYRQVIEMLGDLSPVRIDRLYVLGGGSRNNFLNQMTADAAGVTVVKGAVESTAIGNVMMQARAAGVVDTIEQMRDTIAASLGECSSFTPRDTQLWQEPYERFLRLPQ